MEKKTITNELQNKDIEFIKSDICKLQTNYQVLNDHSSKMTTDISQIKTNVDWLIWGVRVVIFGIIITIAITIILSVYK